MLLFAGKVIFEIVFYGPAFMAPEDVSTKIGTHNINLCNCQV